MVDQRILRGKQAHVRIGLLHDAKNGLGRIHADAPALDDPLLPHPRQGGKGALERDLELLLPGGRQQFVVGRDVVYECDVKPANSHALQAVLDRTAQPRIFQTELFQMRENTLDYLRSAGLLWAINGGRLLELHRDWAVPALASV